MILRFGPGVRFCPSKLFRDDPAFDLHMRRLWVEWKGGSLGDVGQLDEAQFEDLYAMMKIWTEVERDSNYSALGMMIGGDPEAKS
jgi:hypothetical protein